MFGLKFCFFVVMGGFQVSIEDIHPSGATRALPKHLALSLDGICLLAELGYMDLLVVPDTELDDKSKASPFQKCLVLLQLLWMITQCIARKTQVLPIPLLETHVLVNVACSIAVYAVWFKKPIDIQEPICLPTERFQDALALMVQEQFCEQQNIRTCLYPKQTTEDETPFIGVSADSSTMPPIDKPGTPTLRPITKISGDSI